MAVCEWCGVEFDSCEAADTFEMETMLSYNNLRKCLCGDCAIEAIEDLVDGVYYETCEKCGKTFDLITESAEFDSHFSEANGVGLRDLWDYHILCCDCALDLLPDDEGIDY